jgi:hypothetical protein
MTPHCPVCLAEPPCQHSQTIRFTAQTSETAAGGNAAMVAFESLAYVVVRLDAAAPHSPKIKHLALSEARDEAARLAEKHPGCTFLVCEIITAFCTAPVAHELRVNEIPLKVKLRNDK